MSGKVAVSVLLGPDVIVSVTSVKVTLTNTGVIPSGHVKPAVVIGVVLTLNVPLPDRVLNVCVPDTTVVDLFSPLGCWSLLPLLMQPRVTSAFADSVAVADVPAPATSPVAVRDAEVDDFVAVTSGDPTKWRPPVCVTEVGPTAKATVEIAATAPISAARPK